MKKVLLLLWVLACCGTLEARKNAKPVQVIFIGNSITQGARHAKPHLTAPPLPTCVYLGKSLKRPVSYVNCGVSGATTADFLPAYPHSSKQLFPRLEEAVAEMKPHQGPIFFSIMLGTNDSACSGPTGSPVSASQYGQNLDSLMARLRPLAPGCVFVLHRPIWYSPSTYNGAMYLKAGLQRLNTYPRVLDSLAQAYPDVYLGDQEAYGFFEEQRRWFDNEEGNAGPFHLHPNEKGAKQDRKSVV